MAGGTDTQANPIFLKHVAFRNVEKLVTYG